MASLGKLVADLALDAAQFFTGMTKAEHQAEQFAHKFDKAMLSAAKSFGSFVGGLAGGAALAATFRASLEYAEQIDKLGKQTGIAAEELDRLGIIAKQNGTDVAALAKVHKELGESMLKAQNEGSKEAKIFESLGIATKNAGGGLRSMEAVMGDLGTAFKNSAPGAEQMAVAVALFGKQGIEMLPILRNWAEEQEKARMVQEAFGATTAETTKGADDFGDALTLLGEGARRSFYPIIEEVGGALMRVTMAFISSSKEGGAFGNIMAGIGKGLKDLVELFGSLAIGIGGTFKAMGTGLGAQAAALAALLRGDFSQAWTIAKEGVADTKKILDDTDRAIKDIRQPLIDTGKETNRWADATTNMARAARAATAEVKKQGDTVKVTTDWLRLWAALSKIAAEEWDRLWKEENADDILKQANDLEELVNKLRMEAEQAGMTATEIALLNIERSRQLQLIGQTNPEVIKLINSYHDEARMHVQLRAERERGSQSIKDQSAALSDQQQYWESLADKASDFFAGFINGSRSMKDEIKNLAATFKNVLLKVLFDATVKPFIVRIGMALFGGGAPGMASASGGGGGFDLLSMLGGGGGLDIGGILGGNFGSLMNIGGLSSMFSSMAGSFATSGLGSMMGLSAPLFGVEAAGALGLTGAGAGLMGAMGMLGTVLPYVGIALAIASALGAFERGGPKSGGFAATASLADLGLNERFFTPDQSDSMLQEMVDGIQQTFKTTLEALGGKGSGNFAVGFDTDPEGTANNRLVVGAFVNGKQVYNFKSGDDSLGRDEEALKKALDIESKRALLAALQASDLPAAVGAMLRQFTASTASEADIANAIEGASAIKAVLDILARDPLKDLAETLDAARGGPLYALNKMGEELRKLSMDFDGSAESAKALAAATGDYYKAQMVLLVQLEQLKEQLIGPEGLFAQTAEQFKLASMTEDEQYTYWQQQAAKYQDLLATATTPEDIAKYAQLATQAMTNAFNLLDDEEKKALLDQYLAGLSRLDAITEDRLNDVTDTITNAVATTLSEVGAKLDAFAEKINGAANTNDNAAKVFMAAVNTPIKVSVTVLHDEDELNG